MRAGDFVDLDTSSSDGAPSEVVCGSNGVMVFGGADECDMAGVGSNGMFEHGFKIGEEDFEHALSVSAGSLCGDKVGTGGSTEEVVALFVERHATKFVDGGMRFAGEHVTHDTEKVLFAGLTAGFDRAGVKNGEEFDLFAEFVKAARHFDSEVSADGPTGEAVRSGGLLFAERFDVVSGHGVDVIVRQAVVVKAAGLDAVDGLVGSEPLREFDIAEDGTASRVDDKEGAGITLRFEWHKD